MKTPKDSSKWVDYGNVLSVEGKFGLAKICYNQALALDKNNYNAQNNLAALNININGDDNWYVASQSAYTFKNIIKKKNFFYLSKENRGKLLNYYRLFKKSKTEFEQLLVKEKQAVNLEGLAVALQGTGQVDKSKAQFELAIEEGLSSSKFSSRYNKAARLSLNGKSGAEDCYDLLRRFDEEDHTGFELSSIQHLKRTCYKWMRNE